MINMMELAFFPFTERPLSFRRARSLSTVKLCRFLSGTGDDPSAYSKITKSCKYTNTTKGLYSL